ncbi:MAG: hypothetical protein WC522_09250 [Candidatus Omnitrophota bacterium]
MKTLRQDNAKKKFIGALVSCENTIIPKIKADIAATPTGIA